MGFNFDDSGYVDVAERIRQLKAKHPEAVLRPANPERPFEVMEIGGREFIVYTAACYRSPDDPMPAIAVAAEPAIGKTSFTRDSEVMNAETSAWGRAILAALACDSHRVASADEVRNRVADQQQDDSWRDSEPVAPRRAVIGSKAAPNGKPAFSSTKPCSPKQVELITKLATEVLTENGLAAMLQEDYNGRTLEQLNGTEASALITVLLGKKGT